MPRERNEHTSASVERIIRRLDELGEPAAAERLRVALVGSTSGEILGALSVELAALRKTPLRDDEQVGELLRDTRDAVDEALKPGIRRLRRLRRRLRLGG
jgi:hypothetical protein